MFHPQAANAFKNINGAATTTVKVGGGMLHSITINTPATGAITVFDNTAASGTAIASINPTTSVGPCTLIFDAEFRTGLTVVTNASQDITVNYC